MELRTGGIPRTVYLDYAKGIGILLVILGHVIEFSDKTEYSVIAFNWIYSFHMPLFFIVSGMIAGLKCQRSRCISCVNEVQKSVRRLFIPYFTWSFIYLFISFSHYGKISLERLYAVLTFRGLAPIWFLIALFFSEWIFWHAIKRINHIYIYILILFITSLIGSQVYNTYKAVIPILEKYPMIFVGRQMIALCFFMIGFKWYSVYSKIAKYKKVVLAIAVLTFTSVNIHAINKVNMHTFDFDSLAVFYLTGVLGSLGLLIFCDCLRENITVLSKIGRRSFDLMMVHYPPMPAVKLSIILVSALLGYQSILGIFLFSTILALAISELLIRFRKMVMQKGFNPYI